MKIFDYNILIIIKKKEYNKEDIRVYAEKICKPFITDKKPDLTTQLECIQKIQKYFKRKKLYRDVPTGVENKIGLNHLKNLIRYTFDLPVSDLDWKLLNANLF